MLSKNGVIEIFSNNPFHVTNMISVSRFSDMRIVKFQRLSCWLLDVCMVNASSCGDKTDVLNPRLRLLLSIIDNISVI